jgi:hypothetical protein
MLDDGGWELVAGVRDRLHPGTLSSPLTERHCSRDNAFQGSALGDLGYRDKRLAKALCITVEAVPPPGLRAK